MKKLLYFVLAVIVLGSCTGKRYGHYTYVKRAKAPVAETKKLPEKKPAELPKAMAGKMPFATTLHPGDTGLVYHTVAPPQKQVPAHTPQKRVDRKDKASAPQPQNKAKNNIDEEPIPNRKANTAFFLAITGWVASLLGIFLPFAVFVAPLLELIALILAIIALSEIKDNPGVYNNKGKAQAALALSIIYFALAILIVLLYLLIIVLILSL